MYSAFNTFCCTTCSSSSDDDVFLSLVFPLQRSLNVAWGATNPHDKVHTDFHVSGTTIPHTFLYVTMYLEKIARHYIIPCPLFISVEPVTCAGRRALLLHVQEHRCLLPSSLLPTKTTSFHTSCNPFCARPRLKYCTLPHCLPQLMCSYNMQ